MSQDTAVAMLARMESGEVTSEEIVRSLLDRADQARRLNVFVHLDADLALEQAREVDRKRRAGCPSSLA